LAQAPQFFAFFYREARPPVRPFGPRLIYPGPKRRLRQIEISCHSTDGLAFVEY